jgi:hypothetical protein
MKHFTVIYSMKAEDLAAWMQKSEDERKEAEASLKEEWDAWAEAHKDTIKTIGLGKTTRVTSEGTAPAQNGLMLSSYVAGESAEEVAEMFKEHPHLKIPGAWIDVMEAQEL